MCISEKCAVCNHDLIQNYFREIQKRVVGCTESIILLDSFQFTNDTLMSMKSRDAVHPSSEIVKIQAQFTLQALHFATTNCTVIQRNLKCFPGVPEVPQEEIDSVRPRYSYEIKNIQKIPCYSIKKEDNLVRRYVVHESTNEPIYDISNTLKIESY